MSRKKGWIKIMEASIAITIIMGFMVLVYSRVIEPPPRSEGILTWEISILDELKSDPFLRNEIIENTAACTSNSGPVYSFLSNRIPGIFPGFWFECKVCSPEDICAPTKYREEMYAEERIISATLTEFTPRKIKLFVWPLEEGEEIVPPECTIIPTTCAWQTPCTPGQPQNEVCTDTCGNQVIRNTQTCSSQDTTPPLSIQNLVCGTLGSYVNLPITCNWVNPIDPDRTNILVVLDGAEIATLSSSTINYPIASSMTPRRGQPLYSVIIKTRDAAGNKDIGISKNCIILASDNTYQCTNP